MAMTRVKPTRNVRGFAFLLTIAPAGEAISPETARMTEGISKI